MKTRPLLTVEQYFGNKAHTEEQAKNAVALIHKVTTLLYIAECDGAYEGWIDQDTGTQISGAKGGSGDGGFRLPSSKTGAKSSSHKDANGIDPYDPYRKLAQWCIKHPEELDKCGLWMEDPRWTPNWCHFQTVPPKSGKRIYIPSSSAPLAPALEGQKPIPFIVK